MRSKTHEAGRHRSGWLKGIALTGSGLLLAGVPGLIKARASRGMDASPPVSAVQGLLRDHGVLNRILLIYEECLRRLRSGVRFDPGVLAKSTTIIQNFIEDYHEDMEERYVFPVLQNSAEFYELIAVLRTQHVAGKGMTAAIRHLADHAVNESEQRKLESEISRFVRMYRPHEAREDTLLFPAFKRTADPKEYEEIGKKFQQRAHQLFGLEGFDQIVAQIGELEKALGIYDLKQFV